MILYTLQFFFFCSLIWHKWLIYVKNTSFENKKASHPVYRMKQLLVLSWPNRFSIWPTQGWLYELAHIKQTNEQVVCFISQKRSSTLHHFYQRYRWWWPHQHTNNVNDDLSLRTFRSYGFFTSATNCGGTFVLLEKYRVESVRVGVLFPTFLSLTLLLCWLFLFTYFSFRAGFLSVSIL